MQVLSWNMITCFAVFILAQAIGDIIGTKTRGLLTGAFVAVMLYLIGIWTNVIPADFVETAGISQTLPNLMLTILIVAACSNISLTVLKRQWKTCLITLAAVVGVSVMILTVGTAIVGRDYALASVGPVAGGLPGAMIVSQGANAAGKPQVAVLAYLIVLLQCLLGFPILSNIARVEVKRLLKNYRNGETEVTLVAEGALDAPEKKRLIPKMPAKYQTPSVTLAKVAIVAVISNVLAALTGGIVNEFIFCSVLGILAANIGFIEPGEVAQANCQGMLGIFMLASIVFGLSVITFEQFVAMLVPLVIVLLVGTIGLAIFSILMGKVFKVNWRRCVIMGLSCLCSYPYNQMVVEESARINAANEAERNYITGILCPEVLVSSLVGVTILANIVAAVCASML